MVLKHQLLLEVLVDLLDLRSIMVYLAMSIIMQTIYLLVQQHLLFLFLLEVLEVLEDLLRTQSLLLLQ